MKVIVSIENGKFFNGTEDIWPEIGDVINLPPELAKLEIAAKNVSKLDDEDRDEEEEEEEAPKKKKKKAVK